MKQTQNDAYLNNINLSIENLKHPKISVIIPVYNLYYWLNFAVASLQIQTLKDIEIILIDDGSNDGSSILCDQLASIDHKIKIIHQKNSGAAAARNSGLKKAQGEYIYFMDGDDWCEPDMLEKMYEFATQNNLDLVVCGFYIDTYYNDNDYFQELRTAPYQIYHQKKEFRKDAYKYFDAQLLYAPWNKLYRRSYLEKNHITFPDTFWDDLPFNLEVLRNIDHIGFLNNRFYHFLRARKESENTKYRDNLYEKREEEHALINNLFVQWNIASKEIDEFLSRRYIERLVGCIENITLPSYKLGNSEKRKLIQKMISSPQAKHAILIAKPHSLYMKLLLFPLRIQNANLSFIEGSIIAFAQNKFFHLFAYLKANR